MIEMLVAILILAGALFMLLASIGMVRMPDLYLRMSAVTKAATLGAGFILLSAAVFFADLGISSRAMATVVFLFITSPISAHMLARAAFINGVPLWEGSVINELSGHYDPVSHTLTGLEQETPDPKPGRA